MRKILFKIFSVWGWRPPGNCLSCEIGMSEGVLAGRSLNGLKLALLSFLIWGRVEEFQAQTAAPLQESITVTAQADPVTFENLSRTVSVINREQIDRLPVHSIPELLRYVASVDVRSRGAMGVQSDFSIRGAGFGQCLLLVNGVRLNDSQTGHHNSDIPVAFEDIERIEVLHGAGSSLYGADAFGGTINIITRSHPQGLRGRVAAGGFGSFEGTVGTTGSIGRLSESLVFDFDRSSGFRPDRDYQTFNFSSQTSWGGKTHFLAGYVHKAFGAYGFYGNSPSREWTDQTLLSLDHQLLHRSGWDLEGQLNYRTHGDRFQWDQNRPGFFENLHRTHSGSAELRLHRAFSEKTKLALGVGGGLDVSKSSNLGDHSYSRVFILAELQQKLGTHGMLTGGLRLDEYSTFGLSLSPAISGSWWLRPRLKARAAMGHVFRVPTFTELYYHDPNNQARSDLRPEKGWEGEAGMDWLVSSNWMASLTLFTRREENVIDWIRRDPLEKWTSVNLRNVHFRGVELGIQRHLGARGKIQVNYTGMQAEAGTVHFLSKYVLDYARNSLTESLNWGLPRDWAIGQQLSYKVRTDGRHYWLLDARISKRVHSVNFFLEATNILNSHYQEVIGVEMPGCWIKAGMDFQLH
jgi:outer membrane cobalamin receptor